MVEKTTKIVGQGDEPGVESNISTTPTPTTPEKPKTNKEEKENKLLGLITQLTTVIETSKNENKELREKLANLQDMVTQIADKGRLAMFEQKQMQDGVIKRKYNVMTFRGKIVVGWTAMKQNLVFKNGLGVWQEKLTTELIYEDSSREEVDYGLWQKERVANLMTIEKEEVSPDGTRVLVLVDDKGKQVKIDVKFVN